MLGYLYPSSCVEEGAACHEIVVAAGVMLCSTEADADADVAAAAAAVLRVMWVGLV